MKVVRCKSRSRPPSRTTPRNSREVAQSATTHVCTDHAHHGVAQCRFDDITATGAACAETRYLEVHGRDRLKGVDKEPVVAIDSGTFDTPGLWWRRVTQARKGRAVIL